MTAGARAFVFVMLLGLHGRAAEHDWPASPRFESGSERISLSLSTRAGLVEAPFVTAAFPEVSGFGTALTGTAALRLAPVGWIRARLPVSIVRLDFPAGTQVAETALGNLEIGVERPIELAPAMYLGLTGALVVPSAEHGPSTSLLNNRALALTSALTGGADAALWTPVVTGLRLGASVEYSPAPWTLRAHLDIPFLVRISDSNLPDDTETHSVGVSPAFDVRGSLWLASWFGTSLGAVLVAEPLRVQEPELERDRSRRLQAILQPGLHFRLGPHVALGLDGSVPVGGNLGGDAWSIGLNGRVALGRTPTVVLESARGEDAVRRARR